MRNADLAMYRAKDGGRARAVFFDRDDAAQAGAAGQQRPAQRAARREFSLYYQPQYALADGRALRAGGAAALADPARGNASSRASSYRLPRRAA